MMTSLRANSGNKICIRANFKTAQGTDDVYPLFLNKDLTRGTLVVKLIRTHIDPFSLDNCARTLFYKEQERSRSMKRLIAMLDEFNHPFNSKERSNIVNSLCRLAGPSSFLEASEDQSGSSYMLLHNGVSALSDTLLGAGHFLYQDTESLIADLVTAQKFAQLNRIAILKRLFDMYYGTPRLEESILAKYDFNYYVIDADKGGCIKLTAQTEVNDSFVDRLGQKLILKPKYNFRPEE